MIFVLKMLFTFVYDRKNENHWSLLIIRYSLLITGNTNTPESFLTRPVEGFRPFTRAKKN